MARWLVVFHSDADTDRGGINKQLLDRQGQSLTHGGVVGVGEALVHPLSHEHPAVIGKSALDDLVVILFQLFSGLCRQR